MPYGISQSQVDCAKWATVKQTASGSYVTLACHDTKQAALDQMVAVSMSEKVEPIGDVTVRSRDTEVVLVDLDETLVTKSRYPIRDAVDAVNQLAHDVFIVTGREEAQREQTLDDLQSAGIRYSELFMMPDIDMNIAQYKRDTVERLMDEYEVIAFVDDNGDNRAAVESLGVYVMTPDEFVDAAFESGLFDIDVDMLEMREVNRVAPGFMAASARRGLRLHAEGYSGDGLMPATVADARRMAEGVALSADKWRRIPGWIARHLMDLDAVDGDEITPGLVAMLLWGGGSSKSSARRAQAYAERIVGQLDDDEQRKQPRKPNGQFGSTGGTSTGGDGGTAKPKKGKKPAAKKPAAGQPGSEKYANSTQKSMRAEQASAVGYDALSATEQAAITKYTHDGHKQINKSQRGAPPPPLTGLTLEKNQKQADLVDGVIQRTPPLSAPIVVERGVNAKALGVSKSSDIEGLVGGEFVDKGIVSTTLSSKVSDKFAKGKQDVTMVINVPKGSKAYAVPDELEFFNPMNVSDSFEREVMLPRNTKFKITAYDQSSGKVFVDVVPTDGRSAVDDDEQREQPRKPNGQFASTGGASTSDDTGGDTPGGGATADIGGTEAEYESTFTTLQNDQADYIENLPGEQLESIVEYTSSAHYDINKHMRGAPPPPIENQDIIDSAERHAGLVNNAIHDAPSLSSDITVYRGIDKQVLGVKAGTSADTLDSSLTGAVFSDGGIISTSISSSEAKSFSDDSVVLAVRVPKGSKALYVDDISTHPGEREVLLPMDTDFKILGVQRPVTGKLKGQIVVSVEATTPRANIYERLGL